MLNCKLLIGGLACAVLAMVFASAPLGAVVVASETVGSGLAIPRFVSLKSDRVNVRAGPTKDNDVSWVYMRTGLPVEITAEFENWRRIRDWEGAEGWVYHSLLSGRRTGMIAPSAKSKTGSFPVHASADAQSAVLARLQPGVLGTVKHCTGTWCRVTGNGYDGWIEQDRLWGVYPNEKIE
jgi:SH3-like domain-containing protein